MVSVGNECPNKTARLVSRHCANIPYKDNALLGNAKRRIDVDRLNSGLPLLPAEIEHAESAPKGQCSTYRPNGYPARRGDPVTGPVPG